MVLKNLEEKEPLFSKREIEKLEEQRSTFEKSHHIEFINLSGFIQHLAENKSHKYPNNSGILNAAKKGVQHG